MGFSLKWAMAGAFTLSTLIRVPIKGKTVLGPNSHASAGLKAFPDKVLRGPLRHFHPTNGIADDLWDRVQKARAATRNWQTDAVEIAKHVTENFTAAERALMSDWIEQVNFPGGPSDKLAGGFKGAEQRVKDMGDEMARFAEDIGYRLVNAGMLDADSFNALKGQYLHRYYVSRIKNKQSWFGLRDTINGSWGKRRGEAKLIAQPTGQRTPREGDVIFEMRNPTTGEARYAQVSDVTDLESKGWVKMKRWKIDKLLGDKMALWRDYTPAERKAMGEIRDAAYRFARGTMEASHDLTLGELFADLAGNAKWASKTPVDGWVRVPETSVGSTAIKKYGKLSGMHVPQEVMDALKVARKPWTNTETQWFNSFMRGYLALLSAWKVGKTAYNPATHLRNVMANVTLSMVSGDVGPQHLYRAMQAMRRGDPVVEEARRAGLSIDTNIHLGDEVKELERIALGGSGPDPRGWYARSLNLFVNNKLTNLYQNEDTVFKLASYMNQRKAGASEADAVKHAHSLYFDYGDVPLGVQLVRDTYVPFISYQYKVAPVMAKLWTEKPHRMIAAFGVLSGASIASYGTLYPDAPAAREDYERELLPKWLKGTGPFGAPRSIRLPANREDTATGEDRALFFNSRYMMPGGDLLDMVNNTEFGPSLWPQALGGSPLGGNPVIQMVYGAMTGNDPFFDKAFLPHPDADYFDDDVPAWQKRENVTALARWLSYQVAPPTATWTIDKVGNALVGEGAIDPDGGLAEYMEWTGTDFAGRQLQIEQALLQIIGLKVDDVNPEEQSRFRLSEHKARIWDAKRALRRSVVNQRLGTREKERRERALDDAVDRMSEDTQKVNRLREEAQ